VSKFLNTAELVRLYESTNDVGQKDVTKRIQDAAILHPKFKEALRAIRYAHSMHGSKEAGMILTGLTGTGKTTAVDTYIDAYLASRPDLETDELTKLPILKVKLTGRPTYKGLHKQILLAADHVKVSGDSTDLYACIKTMVKEQGVEMLIIDEFQHLLSEQARISTRDVLNLIKNLMDECKFTCLLAGLPDGLEAFVKHDELRQRFAMNRFQLNPFSIKESASIQEFKKYLEVYDKKLKEEGIRSISLASKFMLPRIYLATLGLPRAIIGLISSTLDLNDIKAPLTKHHYAKGYASIFLDNDLNSTFNPFLAQDAAVFNRLEEQ